MSTVNVFDGLPVTWMKDNIPFGLLELRDSQQKPVKENRNTIRNKVLRSIIIKIK